MISKIFHVWMIITLLVVFTLFAGCGKYSMESVWLDREITIDGQDEDWRNATTHKEDINCAVGIMNDSENIYISLTPWSRMTQGQIITSGLTVWFDTSGKKVKQYGITFPLGGTSHEGLRPMKAQRDETVHKLEMYAQSQKELQLIYGIDEEPITMSLEEAGDMGILVAVGNSDGRLSYEIKVPISSLKKDSYSIVCKPGDTIDVGFETGEMTYSREDPDSNYDRYIRSGERSSGLISERSKRSNRRYGPMPGGRMPEPFTLWASVALADNITNE